jgi:hypothetical protein
VDMVKRFVGLVVVPGKHIQKIEVEEWRDRVKGRGRIRRKSRRIIGRRWGRKKERLEVEKVACRTTSPRYGYVQDSGRDCESKAWRNTISREMRHEPWATKGCSNRHTDIQNA